MRAAIGASCMFKERWSGTALRFWRLNLCKLRGLGELRNAVPCAPSLALVIVGTARSVIPV